jgi:hypothetical protein
MWLMRGAGLSLPASVAGGLVFALLPAAAGFDLYDRWLVDPLAFVLLALACAAAVRRLPVLLVAAVAVGALDKETAVFGALFALAWCWRDARMRRAALVALALCFAVLIALHVAIHPTSTAYVVEVPTVPRLVTATWGTWGPLLPLALPALVRRPAHGLLALAATAQVVVSADVARVVVYGFPAVLPAAAMTAEAAARYVAGRVRQ